MWKCVFISGLLLLRDYINYRHVQFQRRIPEHKFTEDLRTAASLLRSSGLLKRQDPKPTLFPGTDNCHNSAQESSKKSKRFWLQVVAKDDYTQKNEFHLFVERTRSHRIFVDSSAC